ncbi:MAG TPA: ATP-binding protein [Bryobacteraceae bacterium]|jgi:hypothetical protein|nr:ATP-binding protein [Bryobacteraceae bacterium]
MGYSPIESETALPLIGLVGERKRLLEAILRGESLVLLGPRGCGKTRVIRSVLDDLPNRPDVIYNPYSPTLHDLLISLTRALFQSRHKYLLHVTPKSSEVEQWLSRQTSVHLRGLLWNALKAEPRTIVLDGVDGASYPIFRFLQRASFISGVVLLAAARDPVALGALNRLFWHPDKTLHFKLLTAPDAERLFDVAADHFCLKDLDIQEFREKVLGSANGNPGQIVEMCRLARDPRYIAGKYIKFAPLRIDAMMRYLG